MVLNEKVSDKSSSTIYINGRGLQGNNQVSPTATKNILAKKKENKTLAGKHIAPFYDTTLEIVAREQLDSFFAKLDKAYGYVNVYQNNISKKTAADLRIECIKPFQNQEVDLPEEYTADDIVDYVDNENDSMFEEIAGIFPSVDKKTLFVDFQFSNSDVCYIDTISSFTFKDSYPAELFSNRETSTQLLKKIKNMKQLEEIFNIRKMGKFFIPGYVDYVMYYIFCNQWERERFCTQNFQKSTDLTELGENAPQKIILASVTKTAELINKYTSDFLCGKYGEFRVNAKKDDYSKYDSWGSAYIRLTTMGIKKLISEGALFQLKHFKQLANPDKVVDFFHIPTLHQNEKPSNTTSPTTDTQEVSELCNLIPYVGDR